MNKTQPDEEAPKSAAIQPALVDSWQQLRGGKFKEERAEVNNSDLLAAQLSKNDGILKQSLKVLLNDERKLVKAISSSISSKQPYVDKKKDLFFMQHRLT